MPTVARINGWQSEIARSVLFLTYCRIGSGRRPHSILIEFLSIKPASERFATCKHVYSPVQFIALYTRLFLTVISC